MIQKKLHRFYIDTLPVEDIYTITDTRIVHQVSTVLRFTIGENIIFFSGSTDDIVCTITEISKKTITVQKIETVQKISEPRRDIIVAVSIIKRDLFELIVQKLTELGVSTIVPIISARTIKQSVRLDRLELISLEALEQCGGNKKMVILEPMTLETCLKQFPFPSIYFHPDGENIESIERSEKTVLYIGPEGGWNEDDEKLFMEHNIPSTTLGSRILRTETAAIVGAFELLK